MRPRLMTPLLGCRTIDYLGMLLQYGVHPSRWPRTLVTLLMSVPGAPFRCYETFYCHYALKNVEIKNPVFIIGFWRSGTTYLHHLLASDPRFGYIDQFQTLFPHSAVTNHLTRHLFKPFMPKTRPMDSVPLTLESPQEDDIALALTNRSYYTGWYFSNMEQEILDKYGTFQSITPREFKKWKEAYIHLLQKATYRNKMKPLVLKNPANTGRIPTLLDMFPDARFVCIIRNPYEVFQSTRRMYLKARPYFAHHKTINDVDERVLKTYRQFIQKYIQDRSLIPKGRLVELRYEDLVCRPGETVQLVYDSLNLPRSMEAISSCDAFIETQARYQSGHYEVNFELLDRLRNEWGFAFKHFGY